MRKKSKRMTKDEMRDFVGSISRQELVTRPIEYTKGVRVALIALGYDEDWVNDEFRDYLESTYEYEFETYLNYLQV